MKGNSDQMERELQRERPDLDIERLKDQKYFPERRKAIRVKVSALLDPSRKVEIKHAETKEELEAAYRLLHDVYVDMGYMDPHPSGMRVNIYNALPSTVTFIAREEGKIVATVSLILDSFLGLPMEELYQEEIKGLREQGLKLAEVSGLASAKDCRNQNISMLANKIMFAYAEYAGVDRLCIVVNPNHVDFYRSVLFFEPFGQLKYYPKVKNAPAQALILNLRDIETKMREAYSMEEFDANLYTFFFTRNRERYFSGKRPGEQVIMTPELLRYFFVEKTSVFKEVPPEILNYVKQCYPFYDFRKILDGGPGKVS